MGLKSDPKEDDWTDAGSGLTALEDEAIEWVVRLTSGKASVADRAGFERWRAQSAAHEAAAQAARQLWVGVGQTLVEPRASAAPPSRVRRMLADRPRVRNLALAASLLLGFFLFFQLFHNWRHDYVASTGEQGRYLLADGTSVTLNSSSALDVRFTRLERRVVLDRGEAFFDVTHNPNLPFIVQAASGEVRVIGTAFSVRRESDDVLVTVERGRVEVLAGGRTSVLLKDQRVRFRDGMLDEVEIADPYSQLAWRRGRLIIEDQPLTEVVRELNRYYPGVIVVTSHAVGVRRLNAVVDLKHIDQWLAALKESQPIDIRYIGPLVVLR